MQVFEQVTIRPKQNAADNHAHVMLADNQSDTWTRIETPAVKVLRNTFDKVHKKYLVAFAIVNF